MKIEYSLSSGQPPETAHSPYQLLRLQRGRSDAASGTPEVLCSGVRELQIRCFGENGPQPTWTAARPQTNPRLRMTRGREEPIPQRSLPRRVEITLTLGSAFSTEVGGVEDRNDPLLRAKSYRLTVPLQARAVPPWEPEIVEPEETTSQPSSGKRQVR